MPARAPSAPRIYDWLILAAIAALFWGAYVLSGHTEPLAFLLRPMPGTDLISALQAGFVPLALSGLYLLIFNGPATALRQPAGSTLLLFLTGHGLLLYGEYLFLDRSPDPNEQGNLNQLYTIVESLSQMLLAISALIFLAIAALALFRRLTDRPSP